ncbi:RNA 2',3'-cyclic phosphodiesterase [Lysobacter silvisoli]|uniref:RNA 2',3'-cyclic phosphodiesterase n=1 Tax=Lysobacter silvisoli TaxID=2293254 RepID=A0A371K2U9_9GAMM|nr:RNA 2',3'-cyclic phosphodiesterase [Lysobacter silvisoli]RDZ28259.1 RNA 2',3'-cyclic phosphodiesterase [Lysobacter silvisoli]
MQQNLFDAAPAASTDIHRLFFALLPDAATRARIADQASALRDRHQAGGRLIGAHRYHLTLQFLGDADRFDEQRAQAAQTAGAGVVASAFDLPLDRAGSFRNRSIPWWLGCERTPPQLQALWERLGLALAKRGVRVEGGSALTPHVTIVRDAAGALHPPVGIEPILWRVRDFALIHSQLGSRNAYTVLGQWPLAR